MNLRILFTLGAFFLLSINVIAQPGKMFIDTSAGINSEDRMVFIGYPEDRREESTVEPDSVIKVARILKSTFLSLSKNASPTIINDSTGITRTKKSFTIKNKHFKKTFATDQVCECSTSDYLGFIAPLNVYVVHTTDMQNEVAYTDLIDYRTGRSFDVPSCADEGPQDMLLSPQYKTLLTYSNSDFEAGDCCIHLLKIRKNATGQRYTLTVNLMLSFNRMNIQQLFWVNEKCFVMEVTERDIVEPNANYDYGKKRKYFMKVNLLK